MLEMEQLAMIVSALQDWLVRAVFWIVVNVLMSPTYIANSWQACFLEMEFSAQVIHVMTQTQVRVVCLQAHVKPSWSQHVIYMVACIVAIASFVPKHFVPQQAVVVWGVEVVSMSYR
jgi:hypothetical protein